MSLFNNAVCCKEANVEAKDFYLFCMHITKASMDGEDLNIAKAVNLVFSINMAQVIVKYTCQYLKI